MPSSARRRGRPRLITLSSDLGAAYAAQLKAVLARSVPVGRLVDLAHDLRPHGVREAAFVVRAMAERFPAGSVHLVVVDPGVGGTRAPLVVACRDGSRLVGPDNGVLAPLADALGGGDAYRIDPARLGAHRRVGTTFDGRDLFAPAAARLANGARPDRLGRPTPLHRLRAMPPRRTLNGAEGSVVHVDRFGNAITDVPTDWLPAGSPTVRVRLGRLERTLVVRTSYDGARRGEPIALGSSFGTLELAVREGRAADRWRAKVGRRVRFGWAVPGPRRRRNGISERRR